jgi:NADH:ubiquinone oxidoreductase subunit 3 (subunit A)
MSHHHHHHYESESEDSEGSYESESDMAEDKQLSPEEIKYVMMMLFVLFVAFCTFFCVFVFVCQYIERGMLLFFQLKIFVLILNFILNKSIEIN